MAKLRPTNRDLKLLGLKPVRVEKRDVSGLGIETHGIVRAMLLPGITQRGYFSKGKKAYLTDDIRPDDSLLSF